jgi:hypothetical protein
MYVRICVCMSGSEGRIFVAVDQYNVCMHACVVMHVSVYR